MLRRPALSLVLSVALGALAADSAHAGLVTLGSATRTYSGSARVTNSTFNTIIDVLSASETGLGDIGLTSASVNDFGYIAIARGVSASAGLSDPDASTSIIDLASATSATHFTAVPIVFAPSYGEAQASVHFVGTMDFSASTAHDLAFSALRSSVGDGNTGSVTITSSLSGLLFQSDLAALPADWSLSAEAGSIITLDIVLDSASFRAHGTFTNLFYNDDDSQQLTLSVSATPLAVPEPHSFALIASGLGAILALRHARHGTTNLNLYIRRS